MASNAHLEDRIVSRTFNLPITVEEARYLRGLLNHDQEVLDEIDRADWLINDDPDSFAGEESKTAERLIQALDNAASFDSRWAKWHQNCAVKS